MPRDLRYVCFLPSPGPAPRDHPLPVRFAHGARGSYSRWRTENGERRTTNDDEPSTTNDSTPHDEHRHVVLDERVTPQRPDLVAKAIVPDYALGPHTGSLGLTFYDAALFPARYRRGAFVGQHGSWNRRPRSGYKVIFVPFANGRPSGAAEDVLTGFLNEEGEARGRPVGVAVDKAGALLVADDVGNVVWRVDVDR